jgi:hypothetical protein
MATESQPCFCKRNDTGNLVQDKDKICNCGITTCCWCLDKRPEHMVCKFVDGLGMLGSKFIPRDIDYCSVCRTSDKSFAVLVSELWENMTSSKRREINEHIAEMAKRRHRSSQEYKDSRRKV